MGKFTSKQNEASDLAADWPSWSNDPEGLSDSELLQIYQLSGSNDALGLLVRRHTPLVSSVVRRLIMNPQDAEDAFQATFIVLMLKAKRIRKPDSLASWLYGVAYRTARRVRSLRKKENQKVSSPSNVNSQTDSTLAEPSTTPDEDPLAMIARDLQLEALDQELARLPEHLREPLVEHYLGGHSVPKIAEVLNLSVSAVEGRLKRGRRTLRAQLAMRGVSLSIVAAACCRFQQEVVSATADPWAANFLEHYAAPSSTQSLTNLQNVQTDSHPLFHLVRGETIMSTLSKTSLAVAGTCLCIVTLIATGAVSAFGDPQLGKASSTSTELISEQVDDSQSSEGAVVLAQMGGMGGGMGMGGSMGGGMGGMSGMGGNPGMGRAATPFKTVTIPWDKPTGPAPFWMTNVEDQETLKKEEEIRSGLNKRIECVFNQQPLSFVIRSFADNTGMDFLIDEKGLEEESITSDEPISYARSNNPKVRDALEQILRPLQLTYVIDRESVLITSLSKTADKVRYYDLAFVLPDSSLGGELLNALQTAIFPDTWQVSAGSSSLTIVGSMLIASCPEQVHTEIESFLRAVSKQSASNLKPTQIPIQPASAIRKTDKSEK